MQNNFNKCDICGVENAEVKAGRWIFYCSEHKQNDINMTFENEIAPDLKSGDTGYILNDGELGEMFLKNF